MRLGVNSFFVRSWLANRITFCMHVTDVGVARVDDLSKELAWKWIVSGLRDDRLI